MQDFKDDATLDAREAAPRAHLELKQAEKIKRKLTKSQSEVEYHHSLTTMFAIKSSVIPTVIWEVVIYTLWAALWTVLVKEFPEKFTFITIDSLIITILGVVMSLILAFRTNTAYDRYWEARRLWASLFTHSRNLGRAIWVQVDAEGIEERKQKKGAINLVVAFAVACKHYLRFEFGRDYEDLHNLLIHLPEYKPQSRHASLTNLPLELANYISGYISMVRKKSRADAPCVSSMIGAVNGLMDCLSSFERIRDSPIPKAYNIHLKQTLFLYLITLPFQVVGKLGWATIPVVLIASFTLTGILAIAGEIENPFGYDDNDLKLEQFCEILRSEFSILMSQDLHTNPDSWERPVSLDNYEILAAYE
ncbi:Bestrophin, RFP-TM, chloride channel-domain-containing protein [Gorgonomyces haynaldii]|nr:Bestrophin, RFP-TM, chloride channel-domain-containing protein [Gorgonomyces haynaldii]